MWTRHPILHGPAARGLFVVCALLLIIWQLHQLGVGDSIQLPSIYKSHFSSSGQTEQHKETSTPAAPDNSNNDLAQKTIPKKIWFKLGPKGINDNIRQWTETCIQQNPEYEPRYLTDAQADAFVNTEFADHPAIVDTYNALTVPILKADTLRYLLLYAEGGVWFDTDASCEGIPIDEWGVTTAGTSNTTTTSAQTLRENRRRASLIVGWEFDVGLNYEFQRQFVTWAVAAKRGSPRLLAVVDDIIASIRETAQRQDLTVAQLNMTNIPDVVHFTGPVAFAKSVVRSLGLDKDGRDKKYHKLLEPTLVEDVLILPGYALAASMNKYEPKDKDRVGPSLVVHHYAGSWKNDFGGERGSRRSFRS
ncbi:hypothetical protein PG996_012527 [Apiospora saccharicola]|uniref:Glycosyltransferase family 32 protein n=1 Tax=Apiospora saccharicola TaxID=335842 RepID=A0ABR1U4X2_9PEZI